MSIPTNLRYTESHEWIRKEPDNTLTIGITDHAQAALGDTVEVEVRGKRLKARVTKLSFVRRGKILI